MTDPTPSLVIRTYTKDYAQSDSESEREAQFEVDSENEFQQTVASRLLQNQEYMDRQIKSENSGWILEPQSWPTALGTNVILIRKPMASNLSHRLLNPHVYRNIGNVGSLNDLARHLHTPGDWEARYNEIIRDGRINTLFDHFINLPEDTSEAVIQFQFSGFVYVISLLLGVNLMPYSETKIIVGGLLARYEYDLRSRTDPSFRNLQKQNMLGSEVKTDLTLKPDDLWYHEARGVQVLSSLYALNCPTFLLNQKRWKLFVEKRGRTGVLTFPYGDTGDSDYINSTLLQPMGTTFLKAIVICVLSQENSSGESLIPIVSQKSFKVKETPTKTAVNPKFFAAPEGPTRRSARLQKASSSQCGKKVPCFVSGYDDQGQPIYTQIRVVPQEIVAKIEEEIANEDRKEYQRQNSDVTLCE